MKLDYVECYSGYKVNERPVSFSLADKKYNISEVIDQWYGEDYLYFKVRADDGNTYILKFDEESDEWSLTFYNSRKDLK